jgi:hypothetical protein
LPELHSFGADISRYAALRVAPKTQINKPQIGPKPG